jgi:hypothetical protein
LGVRTVFATVTAKAGNTIDIKPSNGMNSKNGQVILGSGVQIYREGAQKDLAVFEQEMQAYGQKTRKLAEENKDATIPPPTSFMVEPASAADVVVGANIIVFTDNAQTDAGVIKSGQLFILKPTAQ